MAKANNSGRTKKTHNYKPYDTSNSFVKRFTTKVSEILPQSSSWVSRLFSPAPKINVREREELEEEDEEEEERQPPSKRICFRPSESNDYTHQNNVNRLSDLDRESGEISPILSSRLDAERDRAVPGPSGLHLRNFVSSTPAVRQSTYESSPKASPTFMKRTPLVDQKKNANKRSSLNLSSSSTINSTQPSFDTFVFKNPLNKSGLRPRASLNESCFYPGETTYGGASSRVMTVDQPKARVVNVTASPTLQRDTIGTSALRILKALEQFSTPVLDAKKIPVRTEGTNLRKRKPPQPYEELIFPTMPELLSLKRREVVSQPQPPISEPKPPQPSPSTSAAIAPAAAPPAPSVSKQTAPAPSINADYTLRPESTKESHVGSIKGRQKDKELETERVPELNLPNVQVKITSLPKFDLKALTQTKIEPPKNNSVTISNSVPPKFKFSEPEISEKISSEKIIPNFHVSAFKFSEPLASDELNKKTPQPLSQNRFISTDNFNEVNTPKMKIHSPNFKLKRKSTESNSKKEPTKIYELKNSSEIKTGSIVEVFNKNNASLQKVEPLKHSEKTLKCGKCDKNKNKCSCEKSVESIKRSKDKSPEKKLDNNKAAVVNDNSENKSKSNSLDKGTKSTNAPLKGFEGYKKPADTWECKECFVRNKNSSESCVSCSTPKSGGKPQNPVSTQTSTSAGFTLSSSGNKTDMSKTATTFVPIVNSIKKPPGQWECNVCLVQNKVDVTSCVACSTPKPGSAPAVEKSKPTFSFGMPATSNETSGFQFGASAQKNDTASEKPAQFSFGSSNEEGKSSTFKFGGSDQKNDSVPKTNSSLPPLINSFKKSSDKWECGTCLVQNKNDVNSCVACSTPKPGTNQVEKPKPTFSFGIPSTNSASAPNVPLGFSSNAQKAETSAVQPQFTFGSQPDEKKTTTPSFKFGSSEPKTSSESKPTFSFMNSDKPKGSELPKPVASNLFSFGSNVKENKIEDNFVDGDKPLKKRVSFGKPLVSEKPVANDTNSSLFGNIISKNNDGTSNFTFPAKSPFENNSTASKEPPKEPAANTFIFGSTEPVLKPTLSEPPKPISFSAPANDTVSLANNEHSNTHNIFGGSFAGFKPPETENKPFSFMGNSQNNQGGQFTFNAVASSAEPFGSQQPSSGVPMFNQQPQQQQPPPAPTPSLFSQQTEPKPFVFGAPPQQQPTSFFTFTAAPQQNAGMGAAPAFGGFSAPANSAPVFDPNAKPSFNFTGGATPAFSAAAVPNSTGETVERRVRKAVRRTTQHR